MKKVYLHFLLGALDNITDKPATFPNDQVKTIEGDFIGKGMFCNAFKGNDGNVYLLIKEHQGDFDYSKEAIAEWADSDNPHIPSIETFGECEFKGTRYLVFKMPFYEKLTAKHGEAWKVFKALEKADRENRYKSTPDNVPFYRVAYEKAIQTIEAASIPEIYLEALRSIIDAGSNYGMGYGLEFSKVNLSVDGQGRLIFRDVLFNAELCYKIRESKRKYLGHY